MRLFTPLFLLLMTLYNGPSFADEIRPALLTINEIDQGLIQVTWKVPARGRRVMSLTPLLPDNFELLGAAPYELTQGAAIQVSTYKLKPADLSGKTIRINNLEKSSTDVLLNIQLLNGNTWSTVLKPGAPEFTIPAKQEHWQVGSSYWVMGIVHILKGVDHLLFVLALMLLVSGFLALLKTITAFTVAHSITLVLATLGLLTLPPAPTEALIALSIVFLCVEVLHKHRGQKTLAEQKPWLIALGFGLVHGLGFAGALAELGVPEYATPIALLAFNLGVETGQVIFVAAVFILVLLLSNGVGRSLTALRPVCVYPIGAFAAYWTIERNVSMFM